MIIINFFLSLVLIALVLIELAYIRYYMGFPKVKESMQNTKEIKELANVNKVEINSRKVYLIRKKELENRRIPKILYIHGGAYVGGISIKQWDFIDSIINNFDCELIVPDYPLVPVSDYKDVFEMMMNVYAVLENPEDMIFMGDSAGGAISLALYQKLSLENKPLPKKLILISPWLDITLKNEKIDALDPEDKILNKKALKMAADLYASEEDKNYYLLSPINGPIDKIRRLTIFTGTCDILNPDAHVFEKRFEDAGFMDKIKIVEKQDATHNWIIDKNDDEPYFKYLLNEIREAYETK